MSNESGPGRADGRAPTSLRPVELLPHWVRNPRSSVLVKQGDTWVLCTVQIAEGVPGWMRGRGGGWLTASYSLLPGSTQQRTERERRGAGGRTLEIERLIGRSLRAAIDLRRLHDCTVHVDCDVLQADGGTRTCAITGGWLALALALRSWPERHGRGDEALVSQVAAVSVGVVDGQPIVDLDYGEDVRAETDMNVVMTADDRFIEVQGTAERAPFSPQELDRMLSLARPAVASLVLAQRSVLEAVGG